MSSGFDKPEQKNQWEAMLQSCKHEESVASKFHLAKE